MMPVKLVVVAVLAIACAALLSWFSRDLTLGYRILIGLVQGAVMLAAIFAIFAISRNSSPE